MKRIELEEVKKIEVAILKDVAKFCDENNIRYYLSGGTLLGAIRHKGFIPWDDDIDIIMPRPDYERFIENYRSKTGEHKISSPKNKTHGFAYSKVYNANTSLIYPYNNGLYKNIESGIYIDIFPMDGLPNDVKKSDKLFKKQKFLNILIWFTIIKFYKRNNIFKTVICYFFTLIGRLYNAIIGRHKLIEKINNNAKKFEFDNSDFVGVSVAGYGNKERILKATFVEQIEVEFESEVFKAPKGYDEYLTNLYGDYMTPPPPEKRVSNHNFEAYWKE